jgi:putative Mn2+ efflux pump MntP
MNFTELLFIAFGLSMDCFAVAISFGSAGKMPWRSILRMSLIFGLLQGLMPLAGWLVGSSFKSLVESFDHWVALAILSAIGIKMIWQSFSPGTETKQVDIRKFSILISLAVATSIDALITGITFGVIQVNLLQVILVIGIVTFLVSVTGAVLGERISFLPARWAERIGGVMLIGIGLQIFLEHFSA